MLVLHSDKSTIHLLVYLKWARFESTNQIAKLRFTISRSYETNKIYTESTLTRRLIFHMHVQITRMIKKKAECGRREAKKASSKLAYATRVLHLRSFWILVNLQTYNGPSASVYTVRAARMKGDGRDIRNPVHGCLAYSEVARRSVYISRIIVTQL